MGKTRRSGGGGGSFLRETFAAENWPALSGAEGNGGFLAALGAGGASFDAREMVRVAQALGGGEDSHTLGLAGFTALGFVLELFVAEEELFPGGEDEVRTAIDAGQYLILKFH
jgi:hypothetical protein